MSTPYVFISYSRKHYYVAEQIAASLSQSGLPAWLDVQEIDPGIDWQTAISQGIAGCQAFILVASRAAFRSAAVRSEVAAAQKEGKPIYLAIIEYCPFVKQLRGSASIIDCRFNIYEKVIDLALAIRTGEPCQDKVQRWRPLGDTMPFGRGKYLQLLVLALGYTIGTIVLLVDKRMIIHHTLPLQLIPLLVLIAAPVSAWIISLFYSWRLVMAFRGQRHVSFAELEIWPIMNLVLFPALLFYLTISVNIQLNQEQLLFHQGTYLTYYLAIDDRFGPSILLLELLALIPYTFVLLSQFRSWPILFGMSFVLLLVGVSPIPALWKAILLLILLATLLTTLLWGFLRGNAVQDAFDGNNTLPTRILGFAIVLGVVVFADIPVWLLPIYITFRILIVLIVSFGALPIFLQKILVPGEIPAAVKAGRQWAKWLTPGAFITEKFQSLSGTVWHRVSVDTTSDTVTWSVQCADADAAVAGEIRRAFAHYATMHEVEPQQAHYHLLVLSNTTPLRWVADQEARHPQSICIITAPVNIARIGTALQQNQWVDYRLRDPKSLHYLAAALTGARSYTNPTLPEDLRCSRAPYPVRFIGLGMRLLGTLHLILGAGAIGVLQLAAAPPLSITLATLSLVLGVWCFWEAERLQMRRTTLAALLLTQIAGIGMLSYWLFSGAVSTLMPHGMLVQNGDINGRVATGIIFILILIGAPTILFVLAALVELMRHVAILQRWLLSRVWPTWRRTLGIAAWRNITPSYGVYGVGVALAVALVLVDSPFHFPHFHEFALADAGLHAQQFTLASDGALWFDSSGKTTANYEEYHIGYITPAGDLHADYYSITEPGDCNNGAKSFDPFDCIEGADFQLGPDQSLWFVTSQGSFDKTVWIRHITPNGRMQQFPLPSGTYIPNMHLAFDAAGNLWYTRPTPMSLVGEQDAVGVIDTSGHIHEYPLPDNSNPTALVNGPDGNMWIALANSGAIARISPSGVITQFALPAGVKPIEMIVGPDHTLWFTAPKAASIGHITVTGKATIIALPAKTQPVDLTVGFDDAMWYIDLCSGLQNCPIGRVTTTDSITTYQVSGLDSSGSTLAAAPDGTMWLTQYNQIAHLTRDGTVARYATPTLDADLGGMILGTNHHLWFAEYTGVIGEFSP